MTVCSINNPFLQGKRDSSLDRLQRAAQTRSFKTRRHTGDSWRRLDTAWQSWRLVIGKEFSSSSLHHVHTATARRQPSGRRVDERRPTAGRRATFSACHCSILRGAVSRSHVARGRVVAGRWRRARERRVVTKIAARKPTSKFCAT